MDLINLTFAKYKLLSDENKNLINELIYNLYIVENNTVSVIKNKLNIKSIKCIYSIIELLGLKKTNEQQALAQRKNSNGVHHTQTIEFKEKMKKQNIEKYGVDHVFKRKDVINKSKQTKLERYGNENYNNQDKTRQTVRNKYGVDYLFQNNEIKEKSKQTCKEHYGCEYYCITQECKDKLKNKYGVEYALQDDKIYNKTRKSLKLHYHTNANTPFKIPEIINSNKEKIKHTCQLKYGVDYPCLINKVQMSGGLTISKINQNFAKLLKDNNIEFEQEFVIKNKSYDFKINNTLIEINPTYTHNSTVGPYIKNHKCNSLNKDYHLNKFKLAQENGYHCIHVWDWDDWNKIINLLSPKQKLYARKCEIREVSKKECDEFLNLYHLQGKCRSQNIRVGLYHNNALVQIMTFGKPRYNKNYEYELLRLCSHKDYQVIGGSQKLWNHFLKTYNPSNVISYCDNSKFSGRVYETLGMKLIDNGVPSCHWSKGREQITNNLLNQRGYDQLFKTNYGKGTSNKELMIENGWKEVYDCGQTSYIYERR